MVSEKSVTIRDCFRVSKGIGFPKFDVLRNAKHHDSKPSGSMTLSTEPPAIAASEPAENWIRKGEEALEKLPRDHTLDKQYLPCREEAMSHVSEGDVVRSASLYLIHPVNQALCAFRETTGGLTCQSEWENEDPNVANRADITFLLTSQDPRLNRRPFAAIELKHRGFIFPDEFRSAYFKADVDERKEKQRCTKAIENARSTTSGTAFKGNSFWGIKQAAAYAIGLNVKHVALFDWDYLVLITFPDLVVYYDEHGRHDGSHAGDKCRITMISQARGSKVMRVALLGFLLEAFETTYNACS